jgi:ribosomal protein S18 acetylase RimI-like enzyme
MNDQFIQIRKATPADLAAIRSCATAAYAKYIDRIGQEPAPMNADFAAQIEQGIVHVGMYNSRFAGYVVFYSETEHVHLESVAVLTEQTGKGIGKALIAHVEETARHNGMRAVELYTNETMIENISMYQRMGYKEVQRKRQAGFNRIFFRKDL